MEDSGGAANFKLMSNRRSYDVVSDPFEERENSSENSGDSPPSTTVSLNSLSSPKRSRRAVQKKVVTVPIKEIEGGRFSKGGDCTTPPSDSWAWRKYGQKPIKGSPYPRGYYRCSSSKGCPARKQVERNRLDPTMLVITYSYDHNHSFPVSRNHHNSHHPTTVSATATAHSPTLLPTKPDTTSTATVANGISAPKIKQDPTPISNYSTISYPNNNNNNNNYNDQVRVSMSSTAVGGQSQLVNSKFSDHLARDDSLITTDEFTWAAISDMDTSTSTSAPFSSSMFLPGGPISDDVELARYFPTGEEYDSDLFADLGELPECSVVFGRSAAAAEEEETRRRQCGLATAAPWCG